MKILVIGESCVDKFVFGHSDRLDPASVAPIFVGETQSENYGMASNTYRNIRSILNYKYKKDNDEVKLLTNHKTKDFISKTRYVIDRKNTTLIRVDVGDQNYGHISEHYNNWKECVDWPSFEGIVISDYNKGFLLEEDIKFILSKNKNVFIDTKKVLNEWIEDCLFIKINNFEFDRSKNALSQNIKNKLIVTLGSNGALYKDETFPVKKINILNTCGAGDSFYSGFVVSYLKTGDITKSIKYANKVATLVVQKKGVAVPYDEV